MRSFYHFAMAFRGTKKPDDQSRLADWMFHEHNFPKHSTSYDEVSSYLELYSPFPNAISIFDQLWEIYQMNEVE
ncbi:YozE family protein [Ornithinibacillus sp. L9]|uniref:YozE family protein n=1 Tax=Ornithinibacillus caprae TaxID=2678566 RepID=A0A6N8FCD5_9BACI|nr:YozE family protein [Ornithinibacillus caprae]MUK87322.1 YozE family protein [Ornithinibacillus caprae]